MSPEPPASIRPTRLGELSRIYCRGEIGVLTCWLHGEEKRTLRRAIAIIIVGCSAYGFTIGLWGGPLMAVYVALKLPLLVFLVVVTNGLLNGLFAQILGSGFTFRQTVHTILMSFTTFAFIVGALSPITFFLALNLHRPGPDDGDAHRWHGFILLFHTFVIAYAGILANLKMHRLMVAFSGDLKAAHRTFLTWNAGNLFVGAQLAYVLRPFLGSPGLDIAFLRPDPLSGNFYEAVYRAAHHLTGGRLDQVLPVFTVISLYVVYRTLAKADRQHHENTSPTNHDRKH